MAYNIRQCEGSGMQSAAHAIAALPGAGALTHAAWVGGYTPAVGCVLEVRGEGVGFDGFYTVVTVPSATQVTTDPAIGFKATPVGNVYCSVPGNVKQAATAITAYPGAGQVTCGGATFITNRCQKNDRVVVTGAPTNDRSFFIDSVDSETQLTVRPLNGSAGMIAEAFAGTVEVRQGGHHVHILDEAAPTMAGVYGGAVDAAFGSGVVTDFIETYPIIGDDYVAWIFEGIGAVIFEQTGATLSDFVSTKELVVNRNRTEGMMSLWSWGATAGISTVTLGAQPAIDDYAANSGSFWFGLSTNITQNSTPREETWTRLLYKLYGSALISGGAYIALPRDSEYHVSLQAGAGITLPSMFRGPGGKVSGSSAYGAWAFSTLDTGLEAEQLIGADSTGSSFISGGIGEVTIEGYRKSSAVSTPAFNIGAASTLIVLNPQEDYGYAEMFVTSGVLSRGDVRFTWNPTFIKNIVDEWAYGTSPIENLEVHIYERDEDNHGFYVMHAGYTFVEHEIAGSPFTTDANGQLNAGAGVDLRRHTTWSGLSGVGWSIFSTQNVIHRITVDGASWRHLEQLLLMSERRDTEVAVDPAGTDFEDGGMST